MSIERGALAEAIDRLIADIEEWMYDAMETDRGDEPDETVEVIKAGAALRDRLLAGENVI